MKSSMVLALVLPLGTLVGAAGCRDESRASPAPMPATVQSPPEGSAARPAPSDTAATVPTAGTGVLANPFVAEKVTGEDHAMGTHLAYASFTTPSLDAGRLHAAFDAATAEIGASRS